MNDITKNALSCVVRDAEHTVCARKAANGLSEDDRKNFLYYSQGVYDLAHEILKKVAQILDDC